MSEQRDKDHIQQLLKEYRTCNDTDRLWVIMEELRTCGDEQNARLVEHKIHRLAANWAVTN